MITRQFTEYGFDSLRFSAAEPQSGLEQGFVLRLRLKELPSADEKTVLLSIPGVLEVSCRILEKQRDLGTLSDYERAEQYFSFADARGRVAVIEAEMQFDVPFRPEWRSMKLGLPLSLYDVVSSDLYLVYNGVFLRFVYGGEVVNENMPVGKPSARGGEPYFVSSGALACAEFSTECEKISLRAAEEKTDVSINFYSPHGHNSWAGDVVNYYRDGTYHLLFLLDRHHHKNRWGGGAHYFMHLTSTDLVNWTDHGPLFELERQWESVGTGTMFFHGGKYYMAFGWHSSRVLPQELLAGNELRAGYSGGEVCALDYGDIYARGKYPSGANYVVSDDGIHFERGGRVFHWEENPSVYADADALRMYAGSGVWRADEPQGPWTLERKDFPPCGETAPMRNSPECPSFFEWNGYKYLIMGVTGFWQTAKDSDEYTDMAELGYDIYDGLSVPMAVKIGGNRVLCAGWLKCSGWGSLIVHRELIQREDGKLGMKWPQELCPRTSPDDLLLREDAPRFENGRAELAISPKTSYYAEMLVDPADCSGKFALRLAEGDTCCELQLNFAEKSAQFGSISDDSFAEPIDPIHIAIKKHDQGHYLAWGVQPSRLHFRVRDFALANVDVMGSPFTLRVRVHYSVKLDATIIDAEIAGARTIVSNRMGFHPDRLILARSGDAIGVTGLSLYRGEELPL